jgi:hypothetical protein
MGNKPSLVKYLIAAALAIAIVVLAAINLWSVLPFPLLTNRSRKIKLLHLLRYGSRVSEGAGD